MVDRFVLFITALSDKMQLGLASKKCGSEDM